MGTRRCDVDDVLLMHAQDGMPTTLHQQGNMDRGTEPTVAYQHVGGMPCRVQGNDLRHIMGVELHQAIPLLERGVALSQEADFPFYYRLAAPYLALAYALAGRATDALSLLGQVDEVQRVPELLNVVHALIEQPVRRQFVLTGSSARKLRRGGIDLLAGRALYYTLHPFMAAEWPGFQLSTALQTGLLPLVVASAQPEEVLKAYATLYLQEEVQIEGWARNVGSFARFLEMVSFSHAAVLNISNVARECQIERKMVTAYIEVLEDLLLSFRLPIFTRRARRQASAHTKFYLFDAGVYRSLRPRGPLDHAEEIDGGAFEGLVA